MLFLYTIVVVIAMIVSVKQRDDTLNFSPFCATVSASDFVKLGAKFGEYIELSTDINSDLQCECTRALYLSIAIDTRLDETVSWSLYQRQLEKERVVLRLDKCHSLSDGTLVKIRRLDPAAFTTWDSVILSPITNQEVEFPCTLSILDQLREKPLSACEKVTILLTNGRSCLCLCECSSKKDKNPFGKQQNLKIETISKIGLIGPESRIITRNSPNTMVLNEWIQLDAHRKHYEKISMIIQSHTVFPKFSQYLPKSIILHGPSGIGKSRLIQVLAEQHGVELVVASPATVVSRFNKKVDTAISHFFTVAKEYQPSILLIEEIEVLFSLDEDTNSEIPEKFIEDFLLQMQQLKSDVHHVIVIGTTTNISLLGLSVRRLFEDELALDMPTAKDRYNLLIKSHPSFMNLIELNIDLMDFTSTCHAYTPSDISLLARKATLSCIYKKKKSISHNLLSETKNSIFPSGLQVIAPEVPHVKWEDIGGLEEVKSQLKEMTVWIYQHAEAYQRLGITPSKGILLYGPPGTGKTTLVKAVATESDINFLSFNATDLILSFVGESEKKIAEIFQVAQENSPCIIFFDEIQAIFGLRDHTSEFGNKLISQLLIEMDGISERKDVIVIAATNMPELIDTSLLRPGRFDRLLYIPPPDDVARREIFLICLRKMVVVPEVMEEKFISKLVQKTINATGAEIHCLCMKAGLCAFRRDPNCEAIELMDFEESLVSFIPTLSINMLYKYQTFLSKPEYHFL